MEIRLLLLIRQSLETFWDAQLRQHI